MTIRRLACTPPPGEPGPTARLPEDTVVYAIGDVHGRADLHSEMLDAVRADAEERSVARRLIVYLGDYLSRGPDSRLVVERVMAGPPAGFAQVCLKGNHEDLLLRYLAGDLVTGRHWLEYGGLKTLAAWGVAADEEPLHDAVVVAGLCAALRAALTPEERGFFKTLPVTHREGGYLFVHAGLRPGVAVRDQSERDMMWIRKQFLACDDDWGATVVHGHCISEEPEVRANRIGIDTGAYRTGRLTCLAVQGDDRVFLQTNPGGTP